MAQPFFTPGPAGNLDTVERLWNGFDSDTKLFIYNAHTHEFWNFQCQTFYHFSKLYLSFPDFVQVWKIALQISRLFQEFKTLHRPCVRLFWHEFLLSPWSISFLCEFLFLLWGFWFCREVFGFAMKYLLLPWREVFPIAVTVVDHIRQRRLLSQATGQQTGTARLHLHGKLCRYMHSTV